MDRFVQIASGVDLLPITLELQRAADLWDANPFRRTYPDSPHVEMVDIAVRYMPPGDVNLVSRKSEHRCEFWPAWHRLPALRPLVFSLMARVQAVELGSILLTRLKPGGKILPHSDAGSWAPEFYNTKVHVTLAGEALVTCGEDAVVFKAGTIWTFDNLLQHSIENTGQVDRIVCIISMRGE
jgi:mannose-6-phosphate isomerase-like protein (cupin superfamily)